MGSRTRSREFITTAAAFARETGLFHVAMAVPKIEGERTVASVQLTTGYREIIGYL